jgi:hypothetical protein
MLLNNVLAGFEYTTMLNETKLRAPPQGYDSVRVFELSLWPGGSDRACRTGVWKAWEGSEL